MEQLHRFDNNINELKTYFNSVIDWISSIFIDVEPSMKGHNWGALYEKYHNNAYNPTTVSNLVHKLIDDPQVNNDRGIYEYILGGCTDTKLSNRTRIYKITEMDADHVTAWSKGGSTDIKNCQMLCKTHNRAKGNK